MVGLTVTPRKPPRLVVSGLTGRVYVTTAYTEHANGLIEARTKYDVTEDFGFIEAGRAAERVKAVEPCAESCHGQSANWSTPDKVWRCCTCGRVVGIGNQP